MMPTRNNRLARRSGVGNFKHFQDPNALPNDVAVYYRAALLKRLTDCLQLKKSKDKRA